MLTVIEQIQEDNKNPIERREFLTTNFEVIKNEKVYWIKVELEKNCKKNNTVVLVLGKLAPERNSITSEIG